MAEQTTLDGAAEPEIVAQTALQSLHNGRLTGKRPQRTYTPESIVGRLRRFWPDGVAFDPCHGPGSIVGAARVCWPENADESMRDGLADTLDWPERTFCNPPFDAIRAWLGKAQQYTEIVLLCPWRSHRKWFRAALLEIGAAVLLDPIAFNGYDATFPAPLALLYFGERGGQFSLAFGDLGTPHVGPIGIRDTRQGELWTTI